MATSEMPKPRPAATPSSTPRCTGMRSIAMRDHEQPTERTATPSKTIMPASELSEWALPPAGQREQTRGDRHQDDPDPLATAKIEPEEALGEHREEDEAARQHRLADRDRRQASNAATWSANAAAATPQPMLHHFERNRSRALRSGWRIPTSGAATAPLCLKRKARFVPSAESSAHTSPTPTGSDTPVTATPSLECCSGATCATPGSGRCSEPTYICRACRVRRGQQHACTAARANRIRGN